VRGKRESFRPGDKITLAIRPEKILVTNAVATSQSNCISAQIESLVYSGAETQYQLRANDYAFNAVMLNASADRAGFHIGDTVTCHLLERALIVLDD
jgi:ABC-type Fe3+/spermidine/putrescine transport system ATPase subunit